MLLKTAGYIVPKNCDEIMKKLGQIFLNKDSGCRGCNSVDFDSLD